MTSKAKIKIIRKSEITKSKKRRRQGRDAGAKPKAVANVSNWVNEFQKKKRAETKNALELLIPKGPQTDSA